MISKQDSPDSPPMSSTVEALVTQVNVGEESFTERRQ